MTRDTEYVELEPGNVQWVEDARRALDETVGEPDYIRIRNGQIVEFGWDLG